MEYIILNTFNELSKFDTFLFFTTEFFLVAAIVLTLFFIIFLRNKLNIKRLSDFISAGAYTINTVVLSFLLFQFNYSKSVYNLCNLFVFNEKVILYKLLINLFMLFYLLITYKIIRKMRSYIPVLNILLLLITLTGAVLVQSNNFMLTYLMLELSIILIYSYTSFIKQNKRIKSTDNRKYIITSSSATILFVTFYLLGHFAKNNIQVSLAQTCASMMLLLKIGVFPFYNYINEKGYTSNIPYVIMTYTYFPLTGILTFAKYSFILTSRYDEIYQITLLIFSSICLLSFALYSLKQEKIIKFISAINYSCVCFCVMNIIFSAKYDISVKFIFSVSFCILAIYSLLVILKINLNCEELNIKLLKGIFLNNKLYTIMFSLLLLFLIGTVPNIISCYAIRLITSMYITDNIAIYAILIVIVSNILILLNVCKIIQTMYIFDKDNIVKQFTKRTALNYAVPLLIILFTVIKPVF